MREHVGLLAMVVVMSANMTIHGAIGAEASAIENPRCDRKNTCTLHCIGPGGQTSNTSNIMNADVGQFGDGLKFTLTVVDVVGKFDQHVYAAGSFYCKIDEAPYRKPGQ